MNKTVRFLGTQKATEKMCGNCGVWPATHLYEVWLEEEREWVEISGWCAACAMTADAAGLIVEERSEG